MERIRIPLTSQDELASPQPTPVVGTSVPTVGVVEASPFTNNVPEDGERVTLPVPNTRTMASVAAQAAEASAQVEAAVLKARQQEQALKVERDAAEQLRLKLDERVRQVIEENRISANDVGQSAVEIGIAIAEHLVRREIAAEAFPLDRLVQEAIEELQTQSNIVVVLHPADVTLLSEEVTGQTGTITIQTDAALPRGDCRVEADGRGLLSSVESQLECIRVALMEGLDGS